MSYTTSRGKKVTYPYVLSAKALQIDNEEVNEIVGAAFAIFEELMIADAEVITLREENQRLKYENEFMLRQINERE